MPPITPRYTRDEIVTIITDFYTFLTRLHIPASALKYPPVEGWPNITPETTKGFNKSPLVIDVIKHLPYIDEAHAGDMVTNIHYKCNVIDWSVLTATDFTAQGKTSFPWSKGEMGLRYWIEEIEASKQENPGNDDSDESEVDEDWDYFDCGDDPEKNDVPNLIGIAKGYESGGRNFVLDVYKGVVYEDIIRCQQMRGVDLMKFFQGLREQYEKLDLVPIQGDFFESESGEDGDEEIDDYREIYFSHGWPGEGFRKEEALAAVEALRLRREEEISGS
ncbi:hypothetical protein N0V95_007748 [Ascochyta clinopodiicola]|nr:hypothetical protein N0V95_007748 [Ascochyta clinopodiicola]